MTPAIGIVSIFIVGIALVVTGSVQLLARRRITRGPAPEVEAPDLHLREKHNTMDAVLGGIVQGFSIIPGISRSGSTTSVFLFRKMDQNAALRLSFIMSIPVVLVAQVGLGLLDGITISVETLAGFVASFIVGLVTIKLFTRLAARVSFGPFTIIVGVLACVPVFFLLVM